MSDQKQPKKPKKPRLDMNQIASRVVREATGSEPKKPKPEPQPD